MTDRIPLDDLTSDALDALYEQLEAAQQTELARQLTTCNEAYASATLRAAQAGAALDRVLSPEAIRAAAEAIGDTALTHLGRDIGTIHADHIAEAGLRAALDQAQQPTT
ncbi:hypothetical protein K388_05015 [Streptomyces sp. KhCrAH-43]|uniref:hypothetical protein n=1 Tax=unclassified Streptomyces TaxID=2593676 RepID=UPI00035DC1D7|nr:MULTISPECIES: hypothetical protein [unclassified Streptomyces]MYX67288.1 hypothetical protein [Streptomyces sp. SID8373]RAJ54881.1 hypothetical protein K388_05015 [Streptomyces sp. KhCrAH-43]